MIIKLFYSSIKFRNISIKLYFDNNISINNYQLIPNNFASLPAIKAFHTEATLLQVLQYNL